MPGKKPKHSYRMKKLVVWLTEKPKIHMVGIVIPTFGAIMIGYTIRDLLGSFRRQSSEE